MLNYIFVLVCGVLIGTTTASNLDDVSMVESEPSLNYKEFGIAEEDKFAELTAEFEKSYDAKQAKRDKNILKKLNARHLRKS